MKLSPVINVRLNTDVGTETTEEVQGFSLFHPYPEAVRALLQHVLDFVAPNGSPENFRPATQFTEIIPQTPLDSMAFYQYGKLLEAAWYLGNDMLVGCLRNRMFGTAKWQVWLQDIKMTFKDEYCKREYDGEGGGAWMRDICAWSIAQATRDGRMNWVQYYWDYMNSDEGKEFAEECDEMTKRL